MASHRNLFSGSSKRCPTCPDSRQILLKTAGNAAIACTREWTIGWQGERRPPDQCCCCALSHQVWEFSTFQRKCCAGCKDRSLQGYEDQLAEERSAKQQAEQRLLDYTHEVQAARAAIAAFDAMRERAEQAELTVSQLTTELDKVRAEANAKIEDAQNQINWVNAQWMREQAEFEQKLSKIEEEKELELRSAKDDVLSQVQNEIVADGEDHSWTVIAASTTYQFQDMSQIIQRVAGPHAELLQMIRSQCQQIEYYRAEDSGKKLNSVSRTLDLARHFVRAEHRLQEARDAVSDHLAVHGGSVVNVPQTKMEVRNSAMQQVVEAAQALEYECGEQVMQAVKDRVAHLQQKMIPRATEIQCDPCEEAPVVNPRLSKEAVLKSVLREFEMWDNKEQAGAATRKQNIIEAKGHLADALQVCAEALKSESETPVSSARPGVLKLAECRREEMAWVRGCRKRFEIVQEQITQATSTLLDCLSEEKLDLSMLLKARVRARAAVADGARPDQRLRERLSAIKQKMEEADEEELSTKAVLDRLNMLRKHGKQVDGNEERNAAARERECRNQTIRLQREIQAEWTKMYQLQDAFPELPMEIWREFPQIFGEALPQGGQLFKPLRKKSQYSDVQLLSQGGTDSRNSVWKATWEEPDAEPQEVVLKEFVLNRGSMGVKVIQRELNTLQRMRHPNVIEPDLFFLEQEREGLVGYVQFRWYETDMRKWLGTEEAHAREHVQVVLLDVLRGLEHVHYHKVVHCDVKPANVLLGPREAHGIRRAVLADFDLSLDQEQRRKQTVTVSMASMSVVGPRGTPGLLTFAPEVNQGKEPTAKSDMYSFGGLALEALYGEEAATWKTRGEGQFWDVDGVPRLEGVAGEHELLLRLLSRVPERRPSAAEAHADAMFTAEAAVNVMQRQREIEVLRSNVEQKQREHKALEEVAESTKAKLAAARREQQVTAREKRRKEQEIAQQLEARQALEREKNELQVRMDGQLARGEAQSAELQQRLEQKRHEGRQRDEALHRLREEQSALQARSEEEKRRAQDKVRRLEAESSTAQHKLKEAEARFARERAGLAQLMKTRTPPYWKHDNGKGPLVDNTHFMSKLVQEWLRNAVGSTHDCRFPGPSKMKGATVTKVQRIEIPHSWDIYQAKKCKLIAEFKTKRICLPRLKAQTHQPKLPDVDLDENVNELFLFHGTSTLKVGKLIAEQGMDNRVADDKGLYGAGCYFADWSCKSAQYTDKASPSSGTHVFLLCRVLMGFPCMIRGNAIHKRRPDQNEDTNRPYDSIFAQKGVANQGDQKHNEYVVFESTQVYPEYLVQFTLP